MAIGLRFCRYVLNQNRDGVFLSWLDGQLFLFLCLSVVPEARFYS